LTKKLAIYGAGGFGREIALMINQINQYKPEWNLLGFFDDKVKDMVDSYSILGDLIKLNSWDTPLSVAIAIASPHVCLSGSVEIGESCFIGASACVLQNLNIEDNVIVGAGAVVTKNVDSNCTVMGVPAVSR
jgi:hypothetical protein